MPEGDVGSSTLDLLHVFVEPQHDQEDTLVEPELPKAPARPWYRTPSPWWIVAMMPLASIAMTTTIAPRIQIYLRLACLAHRPEYMAAGDITPTPGGLWGILPAIASPVARAGIMAFPAPSQQCMDDVVVQAAVARLTAIMASTMGLLGCMTTAWWGQLSDRWGRTKVMRVVIIGMLFADFNFIFVALCSKSLPGGYWFLLMSSVFDGLLGGMATGSAAMHSFISDCTEPGSRARIFSISAGLMFSGMAIGPSLGSLIVHSTGDLLSVFYLAAAVHIISGTIWVLVVPESLPEDVRLANVAKYAHRTRKPWTPRSIFAFLHPLELLLPRDRDPMRPEKGKDWNLTLLVCANGCAVMLMGSYTYKFQYATRQFGWGTEEMGYWLSMVGVARAVFLLLLLPIIIKCFKALPPPETRGPSTSLLRAAQGSRYQRYRSISSTRPTYANPAAFDLALARGSLVVDMLSYGGTLASRNAREWTTATMLGAFGGGLSPAVQSLALQLGGAVGETGKLFGALSVVQTICSQVLGPAIFGTTYVYTVEVFPKGIFLLALCGLGVGLALTLFVRLPRVPAARAQDATLVDPERPGDGSGKLLVSDAS